MKRYKLFTIINNYLQLSTNKFLDTKYQKSWIIKIIFIIQEYDYYEPDKI